MAVQSLNVDPVKEFLEIEVILSKLCSIGYVSEAEKTNVELKEKLVERQAAMYQLIKTKDITKAFCMVSLINRENLLNVDSKISNESNGSEQEVPDISNPLCPSNGNAMQTDVIIQCIFGFLNLENLKRCRSVCQKWNYVAEPMVRNQSKIVFALSKRPLEFNEVFGETLPDMPFKSFLFKNCEYQDVWRVSELTAFFETWGSHVEELEFDNILLETDDLDTVQIYDIREWISESNLRKLRLNCEHSPTNLIVPLESLVSIEDVTLIKCILDVPLEIRPIAFRRIDLQSVTFRCNQLVVDIFRVNDIVDFSQAKNVVLKREIGGNNLILDVAIENANAESITLDNVSVINPAGSTWNVNSLNMNFVPFVGITGITLKELTFKSSRIDLHTLPHTTEKIRFDFCRTTGITCSHPIFLPSLKYIQFLQAEGNLSPIMSHFKHCPSLVSVSICGGYSNQTLTLNLTTLPRNLKMLKIRDYIKIVGTEVLWLETLVLENYFFINVGKVISKIKSNTLVVNKVLRNKYETDDGLVAFILANTEFEKIIIGFSCPLYWTIRKFQKSALAQYVDKQSCYYEFRNQFGTALTSAQFESYGKLN